MSSLRWRHAFFLAFGAQAPFVSFFIFGGYIISQVGSASAYATLLAALIVLLNGMVLHELSKRFPYYGGYYIYSYYTLTTSLSFTMFWSYLLFNLTYGMAYLFGTVYILRQFLLHDDIISLIMTLAIFSSIFLLGREPTLKYAIFAGTLEIIVMIFLAFYLFFIGNFNFKNPFYLPENFASALLFAIGIPTGFMVISSVAAEVEQARKVVGEVMLVTIPVGGCLAALDLYSLSVANLPLIEALKVSLSLFVFPFVIFAAINDGLLGVTSYLVSLTGLLRSLRYGLAKNFEYTRNYHSLLIFLLVVLIVFYLAKDSYTAFVNVAFVSLLMNLFINAMACAVLMRIALERKIKRRSWAYQLSISLASLVSNVTIIVLNIQSGTPILVYIFLSWIIIGFFLSSVVELMKVIGKEEKV